MKSCSQQRIAPFFCLLLLTLAPLSLAQDIDAGANAYAKGDHATAHKEFKASADQLDPMGLYNLGYLYHKGHGVELDYAKAYMYYYAAELAGNDQAFINRGYASRKITDEQQANAEDMARELMAPFFAKQNEQRQANQNENKSGAAARSANQRETRHQRKWISSPNSKFQFSNGTAEWFSPIMSSPGDKLGARFLIIKGNLVNLDEAEVMERVQCFAHLSVNFSNGKSVDIASEDICSGAGIGAVAAKLGDSSFANLPSTLVIAPTSSHRIDTSEGGSIMSTLRGPTVPGKYKPYPIESTSLKITLVARTAFGDSVEETILESVIPNPPHAARFDL